jgi:preprotein translocase subunit SecG
MFTFLLIVQTLIAVAMITVILMQRSEGGGLTGGSPSGLMTARGAADFLTRATSILAALFIILSIILAALAAGQRAGHRIDPNAVAPPAGAPMQRSSPFTPGATPGQQPAPKAPPAQGNQSGGVPLAQ